jgi:hypothetical protein
MTRDLQYAQRHPEFGQRYQVAFSDPVSRAVYAVIDRSIYGHRMAPGERANSADVVKVVMGGENRRKRELLVRKVLEHGFGITGVDDCRVAAAADAPDIVVPESRDWYDLKRLAHNLRS